MAQEKKTQDQKAPEIKIRECGSLLELVCAYAESIRKKRVTNLHLLYGYACVICAGPEEVCKLVRGSNLTKIRYNLERLKITLEEKDNEMDPKTLKAMIPLYAGEAETDDDLFEAYKAFSKARIDLQKDGAGDELSHLMLLKLLSTNDETSKVYMGNHYLVSFFRKNRKIIMEEKKAPETVHYDLEKIVSESSKLYEQLGKVIYGQDNVLDKFVQGYTNSFLEGKNGVRKPAATFLFAGPPGVGKSYLASNAAKILGRDFKIFDMSEYAGHNSLGALVGFEYTYTDSKPGVLTSFVKEHPTAVLLIDEIEKAHTQVKLLFLQILEGARLTDKYTEKAVDFTKTIVIFTTNCGKSLYENNQEEQLSLIPDLEITEALKADEEFPKELISRFASGNMIMFDHLKVQDLCRMAQLKIDKVQDIFAQQYKIEIEKNYKIAQFFMFHMGAGLDARVVSQKSEDLYKRELMGFFKYALKNKKELPKEVAVNVMLNPQNKDIYSLFVNENDKEILAVTDRQMQFEPEDKIRVTQIDSVDQLVEEIEKKHFSAAILDLKYRVAAGNNGNTNILALRSVGVKCLEELRERLPQLSVYVLDRDYDAEDHKSILRAGVKAFIPNLPSGRTLGVVIRSIMNVQYPISMLERMKQKNCVVTYKSRYAIEEDGKGKIEFYDLQIKAVGSDSAELRKLANKSKVFDFEKPSIRLNDIVGAADVKKKFAYFISYIKNAEKYVAHGVEAPKGVLLYGPPGTGKTSLAKALAAECNALFLNTTGADIRNAKDPVEEIKNLFKIARNHAPAIIFVDEFDVIAKERMGNDTYSEMIVNTLLTEMEGFKERDPLKPVFVLAATNLGIEHYGDSRAAIIDPAIVRRFDSAIWVGLPGKRDRYLYVKSLLEKKKLDKRISNMGLEFVANKTRGRSNAFLQQIINTMINTAVFEEEEICDDLLCEVAENMLFGAKRTMEEKEKKSVAIHEAGHAYVGWIQGVDPNFITIESRGNHGGYVEYNCEYQPSTRQDFLNTICRMMAGRAAELVYYGEDGLNIGATSDIQKATDCAVRMICLWGMGDLGAMSMDPDTILSSSKGELVLAQVQEILAEQLKRAQQFITDGKEQMERIVDVLMDKEYIMHRELMKILEGEDWVDENEPEEPETDGEKNSDAETDTAEAAFQKTDITDNQQPAEAEEPAGSVFEVPLTGQMPSAEQAEEPSEGQSPENNGDEALETAERQAAAEPQEAEENQQRPRKWYAVMNGRRTGVVTSWAECMACIEDFEDPVYKAFASEEEAQNALHSYQTSVTEVADKKLLYYMVKVNELEHIMEHGFRTTRMYAGHSYCYFHFHPYSPKDIVERKMNRQDSYVFLAVRREIAEENHFKIRYENVPEVDEDHLYGYAEEAGRIPWDQMLLPGENEDMARDVECLVPSDLDFDKLFAVYCRNNAVARQVERMLQEADGGYAHIHVNVNAHMFRV